MNLLILGASGLVGSNLFRVGVSEGHTVFGTYNRYPLPHLGQLSLDDRRGLENVLKSRRPEAVICCAAWSWVDGCETDPARAFRENCEQPAMAAEVAHAAGARFVYLSSSYVFDGANGPYDEEATPHPLSVYARSKLAGEEAVARATANDALIARTMGVYGEEPQMKNFVYQVRRNLAAGRRMKIPCDQVGNATEAKNLSEGILCLLERRAHGIWNVAGPDPNLNRAQFARQIAHTYNLDESLFDFVSTADLQQAAARPLHGGLLTGKVTEATGWTPEGWPEGVSAAKCDESFTG